LVLGHMQSKSPQGLDATAFEKAIQQKQMEAPVVPPSASQPAVVPATNSFLPMTSGTNVPAK